jgi:predicted nucleotidyltransferase component of viral defense system
MSKADSVKARLRHVAVKNKKTFDYILTHYFIERLLYRLSISPYAQHFVLKGGLLLQVVFARQARATRDIDLLAVQTSNQPDNLRHIFVEICGIPSDDGIVFDADSIQIASITPGADYQGVSVSLDVYLDRTRGRIHVDIGFGDIVIPQASNMVYPSMLAADEIKIRVYSLESVIAEKFQAMVDLAFANSRMKDFYDIAMLASHHNFDGSVLQKAIAETFARRSTKMQDTPAVFMDAFLQDPDKQVQWQAFTRRTHIEYASFSDTMRLIREFLEPLYNAQKKGAQWNGEWEHRKRIWQNEGT